MGTEVSAALSSDRITECNPFQVVVIDFAGHLFVRDDTSKRHIILFSYKLCHNERVAPGALPSLTTDFFIHGFSKIRGKTWKAKYHLLRQHFDIQKGRQGAEEALEILFSRRNSRLCFNQKHRLEVQHRSCFTVGTLLGTIGSLCEDLDQENSWQNLSNR